jgi:hypothetical protein
MAEWMIVGLDIAEGFATGAFRPFRVPLLRGRSS